MASPTFADIEGASLGLALSGDPVVRRRLAMLTRAHRGPIVVLGLLAAVSGSMPLLFPLAYRTFVVDLARSAAATPWRSFAVLIGLLSGAVVLRSIMLRRTARLHVELRAQLNADLFDAIQRHPLAFFSVTPSTSLVQVVIHDVERVCAALSAAVRSCGAVVSIVAAIAALTYVEWRATAFTVTSFAIALVAVRVFDRRARAAADEFNIELNAASALAGERLSHDANRLAKLYDRYGTEREAFAESTRGLWVSWRRVAHAASGMDASLGAASAAAVLASVAWIVSRPGSGIDRVATTVVIIMLVRTLEGPLHELAGARAAIVQGFVALHRVDQVLSAVPEVERATDVVPTAPPLDLVFEDVAFSYPDPARWASTIFATKAHSGPREQVLRGVSFTARAGELTALVGPSGAGKSTIVALAAALYHPTSGRVSIGGASVGDLDRATLASILGVVTQDAIVHDDTLRKNILYAHPTASDDEMLEAAIAAGVHTFARRLPFGYNTLLGTGGNMLSGGERQRLSLARAILRRPSVLIIDEATSQLDAETEELIRVALDIHLVSCARVVIAHRLATAIQADQILVIGNGVIEATGTHDELLLTQDYARWCELQAIR